MNNMAIREDLLFTTISNLDEKCRVLPAGGHEVEGVLLFPSRTVLGEFGQDMDSLPAIMVRLGTKVSDFYPSCIGFRIMLRNSKTKIQAQGTLEELYHIVSCKFKPLNGGVSHRALTTEEAKCFIDGHPFERLDNIQCLAFLDLVDPFEVTHHGDEPERTNEAVREALEDLKSLNRCKELMLLFEADDVLESRLNQTIRQGCVGAVPQAWSESLPVTAVPTWPNNNQTRMAAGSADLVNVLNKTMHEPILDDALVTELNARDKARKFKYFIQETYPDLKQEPTHKLFPVMLNVEHGTCVELPFGGSMFNRNNTYATINALHKMIESGLQPSDIGIVALYPSQAEVYRETLALCHKHRSTRGYNQVQVDVLDNWVGKETEYAIIDLVRTPNASGNLGFLSQTRRIKAAITLHRNGLLLVGDRKCTINAQNTVTSTKLEKLLKWLEENGRIIDVDAEGMPASSTTSGSIPMHINTAPISAASSRLSSSKIEAFKALTDKRYVSIPDLEKNRSTIPSPAKELKNGQNSIATHQPPINYQMWAAGSGGPVPNGQTSGLQFPKDPGIKFRSIPPADRVVASKSFARQCLLATGLLPAHANKNTEATSSNGALLPGKTLAVDELKNQTQVWIDNILAEDESAAPKTISSPLIQMSPQRKHQDIRPQARLPATPVVKKENIAPLASNTPIPDHQLRVEDEAAKHDRHMPSLPALIPLTPDRPGTQEPHARNTALANRSTNTNIPHTTFGTSPLSPFQAYYHFPSSTLTPAHQPPSQTPQTHLQPLENLDFRTRYTSKYKAIHSIFDSLHDPSAPTTSPKEDRLFRRLGEAFIAEDVKGFDGAYAELLWLAQGLHLEGEDGGMGTG